MKQHNTNKISHYNPAELESLLQQGRSLHDQEVARMIRLFFHKLMDAPANSSVGYSNSTARA